MDNDKILRKVKMKIAISSVKEDIVVNKSKINVGKKIAIAACTVLSITGVALATNKIIESIWKIPEKVNPTFEINDETRKENITIDEAKEIAIDKLENVGFNSNIVNQEERKDYNSENIDYVFTTEEGYEITIVGSTEKFYSIDMYGDYKKDLDGEYTESQAKEIADEYFIKFGFEEAGFEFTKVQIDVSSESNEDKEQVTGSRLEVHYNKKYNDQINDNQYVNIVINAAYENGIESITTEDETFDNNEYVITKDEAIDIAKEYDKNVTNMKIDEIKTEQKIVSMNDKAYSRGQNYEEYYEPMQNEDFDSSKYNYYDVEKKSRNAWVVVLKYDDKYFKDDVVKRYTEGAFTYYVDGTTGEIIGGENLDGLANYF